MGSCCCCLASNTVSLPTREHEVHLAQYPGYPERAKVTEVSWRKPQLDYNPVEYTSEDVLQEYREKKADGWADPQDINEDLQLEIARRTSNALSIGNNIIMVNGRPQNPVGRTGISGRGNLGRWGPNRAANALVTRFNSDNILQMVAIRKAGDTSWMIPCGIVQKEETPRTTALRVFLNEACAETGQLNDLNKLFKRQGKCAYIGYVDDPRNTDNAWIETICFHFHPDPNLSNTIHLRPGVGMDESKWIEISDGDPDFTNLLPSHRRMVINGLLRDPSLYASGLSKLSLRKRS